MLGSLPSVPKTLGTPLQSRKAMLETLCRHLDMVRLSAAGFVMLALVGCTGLLDGGSDGLSPQQRDARTKWQELAFPVLKQNCIVCHGGARPMIDFLTGGDDALAVRDRVMSYEPQVVNLEATTSSRLLTKGQHDGPQMTAEQSSAVLQWIEAERDAQNHDPDHPVQLLATPPFAVQICTAGDPDNAAGTCPTNHVSLATVPEAGASVPGAEIAFTAQALTSGLYLTNLKVNGGTGGAYMEHLLFVSRPAAADPFPDQIDRYFATKLNLMPNTVTALGGGTEDFAGFVATDMLEIHFKVLSAFKPDATQPGTQNGCKALDQFKTNAVSNLDTPVGGAAQSCADCHAGTANANARSAMDITGIGAADDPTILTACNQVRTRINLTNKDQSGFYLAPDPASATNHPFKFTTTAQFTTFKAALDKWVTAEQTAP